MEGKLKRLKILIDNETGDSCVITSKYVTEKTIYINVSGLSIQSVNILKFGTFSDIVKLLFKIRSLGGYNYATYNASNIGLILVDPSKVNYNLYINSLNYVKKLKLHDTVCDNDFCKHKEYRAVCQYRQKYDYYTLYVEIFNRIRLVDFSRIKNLNEKDICHYIHYTSPDDNWITSQVQYVRNLSAVEKKVIESYSNYGAALTNDLLRNGMKINNKILDFFKVHILSFADIYNALMGNIIITTGTVERFIIKVINILINVINNAPASNRHFYVYRGIKGQLSVLEDGKYAADSLQSCSVFTKVAINFSKLNKSSGYGTIVRFRVKDRCLLLSKSVYPNEYEVLLEPFREWTAKRVIRDAEFIKDGAIINADYIEFRTD